MAEDSLPPAGRATWALRGHTSVLRHRFSWKRMPMVGASGLPARPRRDAVRVPDQAGKLRHRSRIEFLADLREHLGRQLAVVTWDGMSTHRSEKRKRGSPGKADGCGWNSYPATHSPTTPDSAMRLVTLLPENF